jgi:N6-adenosine-specific RNA methylase IME4
MRFRIFYADPPWPEQATKGTPRYGADRHFETMSIAEISNLRVKGLAEADAVCFLWTTGRHIIAAGATVLPAWGFRFVSVAFVWTKTAKSGKAIQSLGYYTNPDTEFCLLGVQGKDLRPADQSIPQSYWGPRVGKLASKPPEIRRRIEAMYPTGNRLELFGRNEVPEWIVVGNEVDGTDIADALENLSYLNGPASQTTKRTVQNCSECGMPTFLAETCAHCMRLKHHHQS